MKNYLLIIILSTLLFSCTTNQKDEEAASKDSVTTTLATDSANKIIDAHYYWAVDEEDLKGLSLKKTRPVSADSLTATSMLGMLNGLYPEIQLGLVKTSGDTIFLKIDKSKYLTQQAGSTGAEGYLAEVTYNFTELSGINYVDIRFKQGDHAEPGTYARTDFVRAGK